MAEDDKTIASDMWERYMWLRDHGHSDYMDKADNCENFFAGKQWADADLALLKQRKRPALTINKIMSTVSNVLGEQIYNRTEVTFKPRNEGATSEIADALSKVFLQISDNNDLQYVRSDVFCDGVVTSRGFYDVRLDYTDSLRGEIRIKQLNPKNVMIDADANSYDPDEWNDVIVTKWMTPEEIELLYSKADAEKLRKHPQTYSPYGPDSFYDERDRFGNDHDNFYSTDASGGEQTSRSIRVIERQYRKLDKVRHFVDLELGDMRPIPDSWSEEEIEAHLSENENLSTREKLIKRIRWTVVAGDIVLHDDWSPYKHFTIVPYFPHFRRGRTIGLVENLIGPQELLNKTSSQELHIVNTSANSGWKVRSGTLKNMSIAELENRGAETGLVLEVENPDDVDKIQPNTVPTGIERISYKAEDHIKTISGVSDYMQGFAREDVSAKSVVANQRSGSANLAKVIDNLNRTDQILARNILALIQEFYTEQRLIHITTDPLNRRTEQITVNEITPEGEILNDLTLGEYGVVVTNQPERDTFEDSVFDQAVMMRNDLGVAIPDRFLIQSSHLPNKQEIVEALEGDQDSPEAQEARQMDRRYRMAEVAKLEAEAQNEATDSQLKGAKAQTEVIKARREAQEAEVRPLDELRLEQSPELAKIQMEAQLQQWSKEQDLQLKKYEIDRQLELKKYEIDRRMEMEREQKAREAMAQRAQAAQNSSSTNQ